MPWTLYRYILFELLKVLVLTTAVLVVVLSFVSAIGPLSDGLLGPLSLIKFVLYTMPTVLGFALPFAGAFSATVVFHGMTKDNEILACRAGGLSYSRIFAPVLGLGTVLMFVLLLLSNTIVPGFWKAATRTVEGDVLAILVSQLNQNRPYVLDGMVLYADFAETDDPPPGSSTEQFIAEQYIKMKSVAVGQFDRVTGQVLNDTTASRASALLLRDRFGKSYITLRLEEAVYYDAVTGELQTLGRSEVIETDQPILLPNPIADEAVFFTFADLMRLKRRPHDFDTVREAQSDLSATVSREQLKHLMVQALTGPDAAGYVTLKGGLADDYYGVSAPVVRKIDGGLRLESSGDQMVSIARYNNAELHGEAQRRFEAQSADVQLITSRFGLEPEVLITLRNVGEPINKAQYPLPRMGYPGQVLGVDASSLSPEELNAWTQEPTIRDAQGVKQGRAMLRFRIMQLKHMIDAELYTRFATALATPLLLLLGALLAVRLHQKLPLVVFFWSFLLAIVTLVMIKTGSSMAERISLEDVLQGGGDRLLGVGVLWGGDLLLLVVIGWLYVRVARN